MGLSSQLATIKVHGRELGNCDDDDGWKLLTFEMQEILEDESLDHT